MTVVKIADSAGTQHDILSSKTMGLIRATKESTSTSKKFILTADNITELYDGLMISFRNNATASASGIVFNLNDLGEKSVWNSDRNTVITTEIRANGEYIYIFDSTNDRWVMYSGFYNNNTIGEYAGSCIAGPDPYNMARYSMVMQTQLEPPRYASLVTTSTTASNKTKQACGFLPNGIVLFQTGGTYAAGSEAGLSSVYHSSYFDLRYSFNISSTTFAAAGASVYIKGTINSQDGLFYLADTWWSDNLPSTNDGYYYIYVGQLYSRYQCTLYTNHPIYYHDGTSIREYNTEIKKIDLGFWRDDNGCLCQG